MNYKIRTGEVDGDFATIQHILLELGYYWKFFGNSTRMINPKFYFAREDEKFGKYISLGPENDEVPSVTRSSEEEFNNDPATLITLKELKDMLND